MSQKIKQLYRFGDFTLDPEEKLLLRDGEPVSLMPKAFDLLLILVANHGQLLRKEDLMQMLWQDSFVEEANLPFNISLLRKSLNENPKVPRYIQTVPKSGYRFIAEVRVIKEGQLNGLKEGLTNPEAEDDHEAEQRNLNNGAVNSRSDHEPSTENRDEFNATEPGRPPAKIAVKNEYFSRPAKLFGLFVIIAALTFFIYQFRGSFLNTRPPSSFKSMKVTRLTTARNAIQAGISPDGKYVVYVIEEAMRQSLWLRQISTNSEIELIAAADVNYFGVSFSPDGSFINYFKAELNKPPALYQIPAVGGASRLVVDRPPGTALSPDGKQIAFSRSSADGGAELSVADADGSNERKLISRKSPDFLYAPVWRPDGKAIVCAAGSFAENGEQVNLIEVRLNDKTERIITAQPWKFIGKITFLPDSSGLLATVSDYSFGPYQIWHVSYSDGQAHSVTNDLSNYRGISVTADSQSIVSVQSDISPFVWVSDAGATTAKKITSGPGTLNDYWGFSWTPDGKIVYVSTAGGNHDIWIMDSDGTDQKQLTFSGRSEFDPSVSPDGRRIAFASEFSGRTKIWQMSVNGENLEQVTEGDSSDFLPSYTPDGQHIIYTARTDSKGLTLWKVPVNKASGPEQLTRYNASWPAISPDGSMIAAWRFNDQKKEMELIVLPIGGGDPIKIFDLAPTAKTWADIRWTPDGKALTYIDTVNGVGNIWLQSLQGGPARQLTNFKTDRLFRFAVSPDGQHFVFSHGVESNDVVILNNVK